MSPFCMNWLMGCAGMPRSQFTFIIESSKRSAVLGGVRLINNLP